MSHRNNVSNTDNIIDSRDLITMHEELKAERDELVAAVSNAEEGLKEHCKNTEGEFFIVFRLTEELEQKVEDAKVELETWESDNDWTALDEFVTEAEGYANGDWHHGTTLIADDYFETYAREYAEDIGAIDKKAKWPNTRIDWEAAAEDLKADYSCVTWDGNDYWIR